MIPHPLHSGWSPAGTLPSTVSLTGIVRHIYGPSADKVASPVTRKVVTPRQQPGPDFVDALARGIAVLECWQGTDVWLSNSELAARSGLTRPTVSRLVSVLEHLGYVVRESKRGRLRLTSATLGLGYGSALSRGVAAKTELIELAGELDVYAALSIRRLDKVQIVENVASPVNPDMVLNDVGALLPLCRSASGLAAMSALPEHEVSQMILRLKTHYGDRWSSLQRQLTSKRHEYSIKGYCTSVAVLSHNVGAVAVPIIPAGSDDIFVLACGMSVRDFYPERVERDIAPRMLKAAEILTHALSGKAAADICEEWRR